MVNSLLESTGIGSSGLGGILCQGVIQAGTYSFRIPNVKSVKEWIILPMANTTTLQKMEKGKKIKRMKCWGVNTAFKSNQGSSSVWS